MAGPGGVISVWNGRGASTEQRQASSSYAQQLIMEQGLPQGTPVKLVKEVFTFLGSQGQCVFFGVAAVSPIPVLQSSFYPGHTMCPSWNTRGR
jgi:hypothetical protein